MSASPAPKELRTLLITIGSTLFPSLTNLALSPPFLTRLIHLDVQELVVQYGKADLVFPPDVQPISGSSVASRDGSADFLWPKSGAGAGSKGEARWEQVGEGRIRVRVLRYMDDFEGLVRSAKWVISHAGSGSILTVLRAPRPLLVVPNTDLMDNHQAQLAEALSGDDGSEGYLLVSSVDDLIDNLARLLDYGYTPKPFPPVDHGAFRSILDQTAGFAL